MFQPLKDIAITKGHLARFECIVQNDPNLEITWQKNGIPINPTIKHKLEYRNGVCRLTVNDTILGMLFKLHFSVKNIN